jgi:hypothetical protein
MLLLLSMLFFVVIFLPSSAFAWGPLTHVYLGSEVFLLGPALPAGVYSLLKKFRQDYLYGNIMADVIFGKNYLPPEKNSHTWKVGLELHDSARTEPERAFTLGYLSHLAADTVAHNNYVRSGNKLIGHTYMELKAERLIHRHYWLIALNIDPRVQRRGDLLLERCLETPIFSFKTNKRILKGMVIASGMHKQRLRQPLFRADYSKRIEALHEKSLDRMVDVLQNGSSSGVLKKDPLGHMKKIEIH